MFDRRNVGEWVPGLASLTRDDKTDVTILAGAPNFLSLGGCAMADHSHSCSGEVVDAEPGGPAPRVAMCVMHLILGIVAALVGGIAVAFIAAATS
jgi:hypothetical protein